MHALRRVIATAATAVVGGGNFPSGVFDDGLLALIAADGHAPRPAFHHQFPWHGRITERHRDLLPSFLRPRLWLRRRQRRKPPPHYDPLDHVHCILSRAHSARSYTPESMSGSETSRRNSGAAFLS